ncbi:hypothetical protein ACFL0D_06955 [Thermoproteota archaeon]
MGNQGRRAQWLIHPHQRVRPQILLQVYQLMYLEFLGVLKEL